MADRLIFSEPAPAADSWVWRVPPAELLTAEPLVLDGAEPVTVRLVSLVRIDLTGSGRSSGEPALWGL